MAFSGFSMMENPLKLFPPLAKTSSIEQGQIYKGFHLVCLLFCCVTNSARAEVL